MHYINHSAESSIIVQAPIYSWMLMHNLTMAFLHGIAADTSHPHWFHEEITPGATNLALNNLLSYPFYSSESLAAMEDFWCSPDDSRFQSR